MTRFADRLRNTALLLAAMLVTLLAGSSIAGGTGTAADLYRSSYRLEAAGDPAGALAKMRQIRAAGPGTVYFAAVRIGWLAYLAGDYEASAASYRQAVAAAPKSLEAKLGLSLALSAARKWRDVERTAKAVLAVDPHNGIARFRLANALYWTGNYPDAAPLYRELAEQYPGELDHQTGLGWCYLKMGRRDEARSIFEQVLSVSPDNVNARQGIAAL